MTSNTLININFIMNKLGKSQGLAQKSNKNKMPTLMRNIQCISISLGPAEIVLILNAKESTYLVETMLRVFQTVQGAHLFQTSQEGS